MKVCVSSTGPDLESQVDPRFGRCSVFVIADAETMDFESLANDAAGATGGAGISAAQSVAAKGVEAVITGNVGPNAFTTLSAAGIRVFTGASGTVKEAIEMFKSGSLNVTEKATSAPHSGMGAGPSMGVGHRGGGSSMGSGGNRGGGGRRGGMGRVGCLGGGFGMGPYVYGCRRVPQFPTGNYDASIMELENYENMLRYQIQQIQERIDQLRREGANQ